MTSVMNHLQSSMPSTGAAGVEDRHTQSDSSWKEFFENHYSRSSKPNPRQPDFKHQNIKVLMWTHGCDSPSSLKDELFRCGFAGEQCVGTAITTDSPLSPSLIWACTKNKDLLTGTQIHHELQKRGLDEKQYSDALVTLYAKCSELQKAQALLDLHSSSSIIAWTALISSYVREGQGRNALNCFEQMQHEGISPDAVTYMSVLKACAVIEDLGQGKQIHDEISRQGLLKHSIELGCALVNMYAKCGALAQAQSVLEKLPSRNVVLWNALITGYVQEGQDEQALKCFEQMQREGILPDLVTFLCLLNLCSHLGLVEKGQELFDSMGATYCLRPDIECFACMVDLLGRAGHLVKAAEVIQEMPISANSAIWLCLLGACRKWVDVTVGTWAFEQVIEIDRCDGAYVLMADIYAAAGMLEKAKHIEAMRSEAANV